jgi:hypothetical protein
MRAEKVGGRWDGLKSELTSSSPSELDEVTSLGDFDTEAAQFRKILEEKPELPTNAFSRSWYNQFNRLCVLVGTQSGVSQTEDYEARKLLRESHPEYEEVWNLMDDLIFSGYFLKRPSWERND